MAESDDAVSEFSSERGLVDFHNQVSALDSQTAINSHELSIEDQTRNLSMIRKVGTTPEKQAFTDLKSFDSSNQEDS